MGDLLSAPLSDADLPFSEWGSNLEKRGDLVGYGIAGGGGDIIIMTGIDPGGCGARRREAGELLLLLNHLSWRQKIKSQ